ncbi:MULTISPECIES: ABC transporter substrate-binding protein [unclassified Paenibacillus]|uniref:ABC transporter substrate-binding protein n=1 Tax=unclassified Paenibacillus TaxID=185978 RepID=UPI0009A7E61C|nr:MULTISPECIES: ABC transporter substrate-binding protein [unclassified Paenibacillus]SLK14945.1 peptide/nickel transport system substrate-binding protein [Paenibacillus sp. RU5A]SOC73746.1 peptide/nickel transport system substrate-binding protein [Paenibacillus sp. RU26A]SOC75914.1 peptide/nickel transport system substrate-binding protein [Paenibacillus sp. RU5M]
MNRSISWMKYMALAAVLVLVLSGCGAAGNSNSAVQASGGEQAAGQAEGGNLTYALATSPDTLDPHRSGLAVTVRAIRTIYDNLVVQLPDGSIKPWLAKEWSVSEDGKSYTFKLREDVKFHDGTPFNAEAVKFNLDRVIDPATKAANSLALIRPYSSSEVIDEYTIKVNLEQPSQAFLGNLSQALLGIVSPTAAKKYGDQLGKNPVGTGPYTFVKWDENADIVVAKNKDYSWAPATVENEGAPHIDTITFKIVPEEATRIGSVQSKQVLAAETVPPQNIAALKNDPNQQLLQANTVGLPYTLFFNLRKAPWDDVKVRQAVQSAVDVESIVKTLYLGNYERAWSALSPGILGYDTSLEGSINPDINKANQLLDEQGWVKGADGIREKDGKKLTLHYVDGSPNREKRNDIAAIIQQQLKQVGIAVEVEITKDVATVIYQNWDYDLYGNSQVNSDPNALYAFYHTSAEGERPTLSGLSDPKIDKLLEQGAVETDPDKRVDIYNQIQQYLIEQAVILPIYVFPYTVAASKSVQGIKFDSLGYPLFNDVRIQP